MVKACAPSPPEPEKATPALRQQLLLKLATKEQHKDDTLFKTSVTQLKSKLGVLTMAQNWAGPAGRVSPQKDSKPEAQGPQRSS